MIFRICWFKCAIKFCTPNIVFGIAAGAVGHKLQLLEILQVKACKLSQLMYRVWYIYDTACLVCMVGGKDTGLIKGRVDGMALGTSSCMIDGPTVTLMHG